MNIRKGMTLIEVVVSLAIIGLVATTMLSIFNTGLINITRSGIRTSAIAGSEIDLNSEDYTDLNSLDVNVLILDDDGTDLSISVPVTEYSGSVEIVTGLTGNMLVEIKAYRYDPAE